MKTSILLATVTVMFSGCVFSDSALKIAEEGTYRVSKGYEAKANMTKELAKYLIEANKGCGVKVEVINSIPVTTVKECIRPSDVLASVDRVDIVKPQKVADMLESTGNFFLKATNLVVPFASLYYGSQNHIATTNANTAMNASNNAADASIFGSYTSSYQNTSTTLTDTSTTDTSMTDTSMTDTSMTNTSNIMSQVIPTVDLSATDLRIGN